MAEIRIDDMRFDLRLSGQELTVLGWALIQDIKHSMEKHYIPGLQFSTPRRQVFDEQCYYNLRLIRFVWGCLGRADIAESNISGWYKDMDVADEKKA